MTTHHFGTDVDPGHFVEIPDPDVAGQVLRPAEGTVILKVKDAATLADLPDITVGEFGYWAATTEDIPSILVSGDGGSTWVDALWSRESAEAAGTAGALAQQALDATVAIPGLAAQVSNVDGSLQAHIGAVDPHPQYQTQTEGDARYPRTVNGAAPDASGNITVVTSSPITRLDDLPRSVPGTATWSGTAWPTRASVTTQTDRRVIWIGNPGGTPPSDPQTNDLLTRG